MIAKKIQSIFKNVNNLTYVGIENISIKNYFGGKSRTKWGSCHTPYASLKVYLYIYNLCMTKYGYCMQENSRDY